MKLTLHHINVAGPDVPGLDAFYGEILLQRDIAGRTALPTIDTAALATPVVFRGNGEVQFHLAEQDHDAGLRAGRAINPLERGHLAFRTDDIAAFRRHLDERGVPYVDYGTYFTRHWHQIFLHDPAGTVIEVHQVLSEPEIEAGEGT